MCFSYPILNEFQISAEYAFLNVCAPFPSNCFGERIRQFPTATSFDNMQKNRYRTVLPKEETRVRLQNSGNDYINANLICGRPGETLSKFICTQAPLKQTSSDFWQMVWEQNSFVIVMLTKTEERGEEKSFQYWPKTVGEKEDFGEFEVRLEGEARKGNFEHRLVDLVFRGKMRRVYQIQYLGWPDHGVPNNCGEVCELIKLTSDLEKLTNFCGPVVVHCSAGVGRTGTFVALFQYFEAQQLGKQPANVFEIVSDLRKQRDSMVQTVEQYLFIYRIINQGFWISGASSSPISSSFQTTSLTPTNSGTLPFHCLDSVGSSDLSMEIRA